MITTRLARTTYEFNKAVVTTTLDTSRSVWGVVADGASAAATAVRDAGATVVGQARSAVERTAARAVTGINEVVGQARAQAIRASDRVDEAIEHTGARAVAIVDGTPSSGTPYETWTKDELYERARELDVDGRSSMSKRQLITALRR
jgi:hypothetical protein